MSEICVLTDTFSFEKPPKAEKKLKIHHKANKHRRTSHSTLKFAISRTPSRSQLIKKLDKLFSDKLKQESKGKCFRCGLVKKNAGVSHYFGRRYMGTRWDTDNCDWACWGCHFYHLEHYKQKGEFYYNYMLKKLGTKGFDFLEIKAHSITKISNFGLQTWINGLMS